MIYIFLSGILENTEYTIENTPSSYCTANNLNLKPIFGTEQKVVHSSYNWQNCNANISARVFFKSIDVLWTSLSTKRKFFHNLRERILC